MTESPQRKISDLVRQRGYREGWTAYQFSERQVAKLQEEVGELAQAFHLPWTLDWVIQEARITARDYFDDASTRWVWENKCPALEKVKEELADVLVVVMCMAEIVNELDWTSDTNYDVVQAALEKAAKDVERGVRTRMGTGDRKDDASCGSEVPNDPETD